MGVLGGLGEQGRLLPNKPLLNQELGANSTNISQRRSVYRIFDLISGEIEIPRERNTLFPRNQLIDAWRTPAHHNSSPETIGFY